MILKRSLKTILKDTGSQACVLISKELQFIYLDLAKTQQFDFCNIHKVKGRFY